MWNPFKKKNNDQPPLNRVDALVEKLQKKNRFQDLEKELLRLKRLSLSAKEQEAWWHLYGIIPFREGNDQESLKRFEEGYQLFPESKEIRFSLGQQYIRTKAAEKGFELFRTCIFPEVPSSYVMAQARYAYLWGRYTEALFYLKPIGDAYREIKILDDHFLYVRGLPFFGHWWGYQAALAILSGKLGEFAEMTHFFLEHGDEYDFEELRIKLATYQNHQLGPLLELYEKRLAARTESYPSGYLRMNIAVIKALTVKTFVEARQILTDVVLTPQDFPWLEDVRTLSLADLAGRTGNTRMEEERVKEFLVKQPQLLEPDVALNFYLLKYQEKLRPRVTFGDKSEN